MRKITILLILLLGLSGFSQAKLAPGTSQRESFKSVKDGYTTQLGWEIKEGDTLKLGIGNRERQSFSYIYSSPASFTQIMGGTDEPVKYLSGDFSNMVAIVKKFGTKGNKRIGYFAYAVVGIGKMENYWVDIENAVANGEIIPPNPELAPTQKGRRVEVINRTAPNKYDQLEKLKKLFDDGILTEEEYKAEKQKILNQ